MKKLLIILILLCAGCGDGWYWRFPITQDPPIVLHPISEQDIFSIPKGAQVEWSDMNDIPGDLIFVQKTGWFVSDFYLKEVMKAKVGQ